MLLDFAADRCGVHEALNKWRKITILATVHDARHGFTAFTSEPWKRCVRTSYYIPRKFSAKKKRKLKYTSTISLLEVRSSWTQMLLLEYFSWIFPWNISVEYCCGIYYSEYFRRGHMWKCYIYGYINDDVPALAHFWVICRPCRHLPIYTAWLTCCPCRCLPLQCHQVPLTAPYVWSTFYT